MTFTRRDRIVSSRMLRGRRGIESVWDRIVLVGYLVLVLVGVTTSSVAVPPLLDDPSAHAPGLIVGRPEAIRSDEFLRSTPWTIGILESGDDDFGSPLTYHDSSFVSTRIGGAFTTALYPDTRVAVLIGRWLPTQAFAATWWLQVLLFLMLLPRWFRRLGVGPHVSLPITVMMLFSPVSVWWTWSPIGILTWALFTSVAAAVTVDELRSRGRPTWRGWLCAVAAGLALARLGLSYQPWAIPLGAAVLLPTLAALMVPPGRRWRVAGAVLAVCVLGGIALAGFLHEHDGALSVIAQTAYPGARRFSGALSETGMLLAAPHLWVLQRNPPLVATNLSEASSGFTVLAAAALVVLPAIRWSRLDATARAATMVGAATFAVLASWCTFAWPTPVSRIFPVNVVSPDRLAQVLGLPATLAAGLVLSAWLRSGAQSRRGTAVAAGTAVFFLSAVGGSAFRSAHLPSYRAVDVMAVSLVAGLAVAGAVLAGDRWWSLWPLAVLALCLTAAVSPWQQGFADLRDGEGSVSIREAADQPSDVGARWVSDDIYSDALLMANALPSLSGQQWVGPERRAWRVIDPDESDEQLWNRGAAYVTFAWGPAGSKPAVTLPGTDYIVVTVDPCGDALDRLDVGHLISGRQLTGSCLHEEDSYELGGGTRYIYSRS
jgi:hypothetical protein